MNDQFRQAEEWLRDFVLPSCKPNVGQFGLCRSEQAEYDTVQDELRREGSTYRGASSGRSYLLAGDEGIEPDAANKPGVRLYAIARSGG